METKYLLVLWVVSLSLIACSSEKKDTETTAASKDNEEIAVVVDNQEAAETVEPKLTVIVSESKDELKRYYQIPHIKEFYEYRLDMQNSTPGKLQFPEDLSTLSYEELRLLRNEVFARNGYLFTDGFLRGYFNRYNWYMPIFDVDTFRVVLNQEEQDLVNTLIAEETKRKKELFVERDGLQLYNPDLVVNTSQFKSVDKKILDDLSLNNFSIVNAQRQMPFYVYDKNAYHHIPHYITTDSYLFILHRYFSRMLEKLDQNYMSKTLGTILKEVLKEVESMKRAGQDNRSLNWAEMYCKMALYALNSEQMEVNADYQTIYQNEIKSIDGESGKPIFLPNPTVSYTELKPRGHYTKSDELKRYFRTFKWISLNGIDPGDDAQLKGMVAISFVIKSNPHIKQDYENYVKTIEKLAGQEDNVSIRDVINAISKIENYNEAISGSTLSDIRTRLKALNKERIKKVFGANYDIPEREVKRVYFLSGTYSIGGEIFSKLVDIDLGNSKRPFPRGLDIPAVFNNPTAEKIILEEYDDDNKWPNYASRLKNLQEQFKSFEGWSANYGSNALRTALAASAEQDQYPDFMKTDAYNRKELSATLSSWTHIKHDLILYQEKPFAAQAGQGGGPEPPEHYSFVEPNIEFWTEALRLANWLKAFSKFDDSFDDELQEIIDLGFDLQTAAKKQLAGEEISDDLFEKLSWIGARLEYTLLGLLETDHLPEREKSMALIADVYAYNGVNLNVAVGHADDIYVLVPINGEYYIARGPVFSYYEFTDDGIYNDEQWRTFVNNNDLPNRPEWIAPLINNVPTAEGQMEFRYPGHWNKGEW